MKHEKMKIIPRKDLAELEKVVRHNLWLILKLVSKEVVEGLTCDLLKNQKNKHVSNGK